MVASILRFENTAPKVGRSISVTFKQRVLSQPTIPSNMSWIEPGHLRVSERTTVYSKVEVRGAKTTSCNRAKAVGPLHMI